MNRETHEWLLFNAVGQVMLKGKWPEPWVNYPDVVMFDGRVFVYTRTDHQVAGGSCDPRTDIYTREYRERHHFNLDRLVSERN